MRKIKRKEFKYINKESQQTVREENKRREEQRTINITIKQVMSVNTYLSTITLNINGLNTPIKRCRVKV